MQDGDVAFRTNFAALDSHGKIADRRPGRLEPAAPFEKALEKIKVPGAKIVFKATLAHRGVLVVSACGLSPNVSSNDPKSTGVKPGEIKPLDSTVQAKLTADLVNEYLQQARKVLELHPENKQRKKKKLPPANALLLRGAGTHHALPQFKDRYDLKAAAVAGGSLYQGVAAAMGMAVIPVRGATGKSDTNLLAKVLTAKNALLNHDFVFLHIKGTDEFGHDGDALGKKAFIERVDTALCELASTDGIIMAITGDHSTPCGLKNHSGDPVPLLIHGHGVRSDHIQKFGERDAAKGGLGRLRGLDLMPELLNLAGRATMYGT